jgi:hypothetical protein
LALGVINRGGTPTTLTNMVAYAYRFSWRALRWRHDFAAVINVPNLPSEIGVNGRWTGLMIYAQQTTEARRQGRLYVGVIASHSDREFMKRVPRPPNLPEAEIAA